MDCGNIWKRAGRVFKLEGLGPSRFVETQPCGFLLSHAVRLYAEIPQLSFSIRRFDFAQQPAQRPRVPRAESKGTITTGAVSSPVRRRDGRPVPYSQIIISNNDRTKSERFDARLSITPVAGDFDPPAEATGRLHRYRSRKI